MNTTTNSTNIAIENAIPCRCCDGAMTHHIYPESQWITGDGRVGTFPARLELTCWNPDCQMCGYTQDSREYGAIDLTLYIKAVNS